MVTTNFLYLSVDVCLYLIQQNNTSQMKTNIYIFLILLLSFSVSNAQEKSTAIKVLAVNELNVNKTTTVTTQDLVIPAVKDNSDSNGFIAKGASDIRIFLNRERSSDNIDMLFPSIYKQKMA